MDLETMHTVEAKLIKGLKQLSDELTAGGMAPEAARDLIRTVMNTLVARMGDGVTIHVPA